MTKLELEIGKTYLRKSALARENILGGFDLVKIVGLVEQDTIEYLRGDRFFGDDRQFYTHTGEKTYTQHLRKDPYSWNGQLNWNDQIRGNRGDHGLEREAIAADFSGGFTEKLLIRPEERNDTSKFITSSDPSFRIKIGGVYGDRMGFLHLIHEVRHLSDSDLLRFTSKSSGTFSENGKRRIAETSMRDLIFQRI